MSASVFLAQLRAMGVRLHPNGDQIRCSAPTGVLTSALKEQISVRKEELVALLETLSSPPPPISSIPRTDPLPVSFAQQRMWFLHQMDRHNPAYNMALALWLSGPLDVEALELSLQTIVQRHESLRTTFPAVEGEPVQVIVPMVSVSLPVHEIEGTEQNSETEVESKMNRLAREPFDLATGPLFRARLWRLAADHHAVMLTMHHIVSDGWSVGVLFRELATLYEGYTAGGEPRLSPLAAQYADFSQWQRERLSGDLLEAQVDYWSHQLAGAPALELPTDHPRPVTRSFRGGTVETHLPSRPTEALDEFSRRQQVSPFMVLLAAYAILLHRYTDQDDLIIGAPIANRTHEDTEGVIGCFINTLPLRVDLSGNPTFLALLDQVKQVAYGAYEYQELPFEKLVEELHPDRNADRSPFIETILNFDNTPSSARDVRRVGALTLQMRPVDTGTAKFDLTLFIARRSDGMTATIEYSHDLFERATIRRMLTHFETLLERLVADPTQPIGAVSFLDETERHQLVVDWNATEAAYPDAQTLPQLFARQVARTPAAVAVVCEGKSLTYDALNARANQLARRLQQLGVGRGTLVGLYLGRSVDLLVGLLGIVKAGGAYVPLDPIYPSDRIAYILEDAQATVLVTHQPLANDLPAHLQTVVLDTEAPTLATLDGADLGPVAHPEDLAYVIYTSGSTGKPKGVMIEHRTLVNFLTAMQQRPGLDETDVVVAVTTVSFDIAALELFGPLLVGAQVVLATARDAADGARLAQLLDTAQATLLQATPATWHLLLEAGWTGRTTLRMLCGGEALPRDLAHQLLDKGAALWNMYGPTETTIWSAIDQVTRDADPISIGRPIANTQCYVLDRYQQPVPAGATGELWIGGDGVARGYFGRPELTAEKFIPDPFRPGPETRLYRTGDLARYLPDGRLECLGRTDHQVKIRGFRIELGEIEAVLADHPGVQAAVVIPHDHGAGDTRLLAYVINDPHDDPTVTDLRRFARESLPEYMVPSAFAMVEAFPLTPNGKIDRRALAALNTPAAEATSAFVAPATPMEQRVAAIWQDVLGIAHVGRHDNFFDLGGHSLLAMKAIARLEQDTGQSLNPREMFVQTLRQIAAGIAESESDSVGVH